ncbi:MAG: HAD hydrolase-like protein [Sporolactobacillus sp.]
MIRTILFDVDGVFLDEDHYFDASALTVWEVLSSARYFGVPMSPAFHPAVDDAAVKAIRAHVFAEDRVLNVFKSHGMNANWDMTYVTIAAELIYMVAQLPEAEKATALPLLQRPIDRAAIDRLRALLCRAAVSPDFEKLLADLEASTAMKSDLIGYLNELALRELNLSTDVFRPKSALWHVAQHCSQEWYVGDAHVERSTGRPSVQPGKLGFLSREKTLMDASDVRAMFEHFRASGIRVGIATGRPALETHEPFRQLGWLDVLEANHIATADDVLDAERRYDAAPLAKPHPFTYLLAYYGKACDAVRWTAREPEKLAQGGETLIVGDSLADLFCARQMGCRFAAVLTGLSGHAVRPEFDAHHADYILDSVAEVPVLVERLNAAQ